MQLICKKVKKGKGMSAIADELEMELEMIKPMYEKVAKFTPDYDIEKIYIAWETKDGATEE